LDWIKAGETPKLDATDPDGVRATRETPTATNPKQPAYYSSAPAAPLPDQPMLKSISGAPGKRLAIINDRTFSVNEQARLKLATTNVLIRCLDISTNSVRIRFEASGETRELFLPKQ
jgi:hypothetical protein